MIRVRNQVILSSCHLVTLSFLLERRVESHLAGREVVLLDHRAGFGRAELAIQAAVLPLDRERAVVADTRKRAEDRPPLDPAMAGRDEVPAASRVAEVEVRAKDAGSAVQVTPALLHMHMVD